MTSLLGVRLPPWRRRRPRQPDLCQRRWHCYRRPRRTGRTSPQCGPDVLRDKRPEIRRGSARQRPVRRRGRAAVAGRAVPRLGLRPGSRCGSRWTRSRPSPCGRRRHLIGATVLIALARLQGRSFAVASRADMDSHLRGRAVQRRCLQRVHSRSRSSLPRLRASRSWSTPCRCGRRCSRCRSWASGMTPVARACAAPCCVAGMSILIAPLAAVGFPAGTLLAIGAAMSWAAGTVYVKWAQPKGDIMAMTTWQLVIGCCVMACVHSAIRRPARSATCRRWRCWRCCSAASPARGSGCSCGSKSCGGCRQPTASLGVLSVAGDQRGRSDACSGRAADAA